MIPGIAPAILKKKAADPGGGYSFTMTAGNFAGEAFGYGGGGWIYPALGSIDKEPVPGETLGLFLSDNASFALIVFYGDLTPILSGLSVWVDGVEYPAVDDWSFDWGETGVFWEDEGFPIFADQGVYFIEIK